MPSTVLGTFVYIAFQLILPTAHWDKTVIPFYCLGNRLGEAKWTHTASKNLDFSVIKALL